MTTETSYHSYPKVHALGHRGIVAGLPQWYKDKLLAEQFGECA